MSTVISLAVFPLPLSLTNLKHCPDLDQLSYHLMTTIEKNYFLSGHKLLQN